VSSTNTKAKVRERKKRKEKKKRERKKKNRKQKMKDTLKLSARGSSVRRWRKGSPNNRLADVRRNKQ
jgi:hypothetical protein